MMLEEQGNSFTGGCCSSLLGQNETQVSGPTLSPKRNGGVVNLVVSSLALSPPASPKQISHCHPNPIQSPQALSSDQIPSIGLDLLFSFLSEQGQVVRLSLSVAMDDEELVDQKKYLEERCKPQCVKSLYEYDKCVKRVENDDTGHKHCTGQYFDYWSCIDKCVAPKLFKKLK
ncbi:uncharacterized protein LOC120686594 [Panicum virgatum]|nr:uncharacterized protein LOC120686594 [Panicum virgatum]